MKNQRGFTLSEIIAVLSAIVSGAAITFHLIEVTFTRNAPDDQNFEPWYWRVSVAD